MTGKGESHNLTYVADDMVMQLYIVPDRTI